MFFEANRTIVHLNVDPDPNVVASIAQSALVRVGQVQPGNQAITRVAIGLGIPAPAVESVTFNLWACREAAGEGTTPLDPLPTNRFYLLESGITVTGRVLTTRSLPAGGLFYVQVTSDTLSIDRIMHFQSIADQAGTAAGGGGGTVVTTTQLPATLGRKVSAQSLSAVLASDDHLKGAAGPIALAAAAEAANTLALSQYLLADPTLTNTQLVLPRVDVAGYSLFKSPQLPTALGQTAKAAAISVVLASDDHQKGVGAAQTLAAAAEAANTITLGRYNASAPTLTDGQMLPLQLDVNGNLKGAEQYAPNNENSVLGVQQTQILPIVSPTFAWSTFTSAALAISQIIKAAPGSLKSFSILIDAAAAAQAWYIQFWDNTTFAAGVLRASFKVRVAASVDATKDYTFGAGGIYFGTGIVVGVSANPYTISGGSAHMSVQALEYK